MHLRSWDRRAPKFQEEKYYMNYDECLCQWLIFYFENLLLETYLSRHMRGMSESCSNASQVQILIFPQLCLCRREHSARVSTELSHSKKKKFKVTRSVYICCRQNLKKANIPGSITQQSHLLFFLHLPSAFHFTSGNRLT